MEILNEQEYKEQIKKGLADQRRKIKNNNSRPRRGGGRGRASGGKGHGGL